MRRICTFLFSMLIMNAFAYDFMSDGIYYNYIGETEVEVTHNDNGSYTGNIVIPDIVNGYTVTRIGNKAFANSFWTDLGKGISITLPNFLETIGDSAFHRAGLKTITIPARVKAIGNSVFAVGNLENITLPVGLKSIGKYAFAGSHLKNITLPAGLSSIGEQAFSGCYLESITIPKGVTSIGKSAFSSMRTPLSITFEEGITTIGESILSSNRNSLVVNLPSTLTTIEASAFSWSSGLESITLPNNLITIGNGAFSYSGLKNITVPGSVKHPGKQIFSSCDKLTTAIIEDGVMEISEGMFYYCSSLTNVSIPNSVTQILHESFRDCKSLANIDLPNNLEVLYGASFYRCTSLSSIKIPKSCISIPYNSFAGCTALESIVVENGNPNYDSRDNCNAIIHNTTLITGCNVTIIPTSVNTIGPSAFSGSSFSTIDIPSSVTTISYNAFTECAGLTNITIPYSVTLIGKETFRECPNLTTVISYVKEPFSIGSDVFFCSPEYDLGINKEAKLYVPSGTKAKYETTDGWKEFKYIMEMLSVEPIENVTNVSADGLGDEDLSDNVVNNVYYNVGNDAYDTSDGSIVISETTDMGQIGNTLPGSEDVKNNFNGIILKAAKGKGTITVNVKTVGNAQLVVQVGKQTPMIVTNTEQGDVVVNYDVTEDTYVYIYANISSSAARAMRVPSTDMVKIYGITVTPEKIVMDGDANGDGEVNVADVDYVIERIGEALDETNKAADVNDDGEINVADVDYIIERII